MDPIEKHRRIIAKRTLSMPDAILNIMGGPTKKEAEAYLNEPVFLSKLRFNDDRFRLHPKGLVYIMFGKGRGRRVFIRDEHGRDSSVLNTIKVFPVVSQIIPGVI